MNTFIYLFQDDNDQSVLVRVKSELVLNFRGNGTITIGEQICGQFILG